MPVAHTLPYRRPHAQLHAGAMRCSYALIFFFFDVADAIFYAAYAHASYRDIDTPLHAASAIATLIEMPCRLLIAALRRLIRYAAAAAAASY